MVTSLLKLLSIFFFLISLFTPHALSYDSSECAEPTKAGCTDKSGALTLKLIALFATLAFSVIGVSAPLFASSIPAVQPGRSLFLIVKAFASGIILGTAFMHVLPDSFYDLSSGCLNENPWHNFPFTGFVAMMSALVTLMLDSLTTSIYTQKASAGVIPGDEATGGDQGKAEEGGVGHFHGHHHHVPSNPGKGASQLVRNRVIAMVRKNFSTDRCIYMCIIIIDSLELKQF
ncbi:hypothetical protein SLEP1_g6379 [Rubroshorea leprosula]|uniref:Uncharacterized protein n=1 Tax=Rubroshorea leprosula TaxID=152421 RepID=A0AAV5I5W0_9ROSI|nr:hypothetical protein SLEP1_g6379 [Rubroshorea leprosula]